MRRMDSASLRRLWLPLLPASLGFGLLAAYFAQPVTLSVNGSQSQWRGFYLTTAAVLRAAGVQPAPGDRLNPPLGAWIPADGQIELRTAVTVHLWDETSRLTTFTSLSRVPAQWLAERGKSLFPRDQLLLNRQPADPLRPVSGGGPFTIQFNPCQPFTLIEDGRTRPLWSCSPSLALALNENDIRLNPADSLEPPASSAFVPRQTVILRRAVPFTVETAESTLQLSSSAATIGAALRENKLALSGLDILTPPPDTPLTSGLRIQIQHVSEVVALAEELTPYPSSSVWSDEVDLDTSQIVQPGQYGITLTRERLRFSAGRELSRAREGSWTAAEPVEQILARGTRARAQTLDIGGATIEYYRAVTVYATSYSPCRQDLGRCSQATSSGIPLAKGVIAVTKAWYNLFAGQQVYVPGYGIGTIGDVGGGVAGQYWIDLGFSEDDFETWHNNVTLYFLTPIPANVPAVLP